MSMDRTVESTLAKDCAPDAAAGSNVSYYNIIDVKCMKPHR